MFTIGRKGKIGIAFPDYFAGFFVGKGAFGKVNRRLGVSSLAQKSAVLNRPVFAVAADGGFVRNVDATVFGDVDGDLSNSRIAVNRKRAGVGDIDSFAFLG